MNHELHQGYADRAFLALTIWREARGELYEARVGVAMVILNRVLRPSWWGRDVQSVIFKKWQFSSLTDPGDPQLTKWPLTADPSWIDCLEIACSAIDGSLVNPVPGADSYFDISIPAPAWALPESFVGQLGRIKFYDLDHDVEAAGG